MPVDPTTVATAVLLLVHVPPATASLSAVVEATHTNNVPVIVAGEVFTVTVVVAIHPVPMV
jgi:hypothetical protein